MFKLFKYLKKIDWLLLGIMSIFLVIQVYATVMTPEKTSILLKSISTGEVGKPVLVLLLFVFLSIGGMIGEGISVGFFIADYSAAVRTQIFKKVNKMSLENINKFSIPSLITRTTNDTKQIEYTLNMFLTMAISAPATAIGGVIKMGTTLNLKTQWQMALLILGTIVFLCVVMGLAIKFVYPRFKKTRVLTDEVNDVSRENITGVRVIRAYNAEQYQSNKFKKVNDKLTRISIEGQAVLNGLMPLIFTVIDLLNTGIYFLGAWLMKNGELKDTEDIISMAMLSSIVVMNFLMAGMALTSLPQGNISAKRINLVLKEKIDIVSPTKPVTEFNTRGEITFKNVSYRQRGSEENILSDVSFEIKEGETVAIVGKNGAGKSTIANLISRFYDVTSGKIMVDGVDVKHIALPTLRKKIGYINQKSLLFSGTIKDNIMFGLSDTIVEKNALSTAISVSQSKTFINKMKNKEKSNVVQGGNNFSGGQKQRLSIARTLATNPETIIFDDSFSALDFQTDKMLREELNKKYKKTTKVIIAQRIGTILNANKIVVLDNGKVVAVGTHKELFKKCKMYRELALTQMTEKEALHG